MNNEETYRASKRNGELTVYDVILLEDQKVKLINQETREVTIYESLDVVKSEYLIY